MATSTILIRIQGPDHPGITASLMSLLSTRGAHIEDVEQIVIRGELNLSLVVRVDVDDDFVAKLLLLGHREKVTVHFEDVAPVSTSSHRRLLVTLLGTDVPPDEFATVAEVIAGNGGNIDRIIRLARQPVMAYELAISGVDRDVLRSALLAESHRVSCDLAVAKAGLGRRAMRLVVLDVDSTLLQDEVIELLAAEAGRFDEVKRITDEAMSGSLDFAQSLAARVAALEGLDVSVFDRVRAKARLAPGASTFIRTLRRLGYKTAVVSGGFTFMTDHLQSELGLDYAHANRLEVVDGRLTGRTIGPVVDRPGKATYVRSIAEAEGIPLDQVVAVGDGANDLDMLSTSGLGIAFNARPVVRDAADAALNVPYLDAVLFVLGISREEIEDADSADRADRADGSDEPDPDALQRA